MSNLWIFQVAFSLILVLPFSQLTVQKFITYFTFSFIWLQFARILSLHHGLEVQSKFKQFRYKCIYYII